ncbi:MAG: hypothetical protein NTX82_03210 [Candidatus Parcubacteria bacterium]|nr:hypothetical protein [Candidatus Parcubacteria bacterium]
MKNKIIFIIVIVILLVLLAIVAILAYNFFISSRLQPQPNVNINGNLTLPPEKQPITFEIPEWDLNNILDFYEPRVSWEYQTELYKNIGLNDAAVCDNNKNLLPFEDNPVQDPNKPFPNLAISESCKNQYNAFQYLKNGNEENLNAITTENARKTAKAIRENNVDLCPGPEYPTCTMSFGKSCLDKKFMMEDNAYGDLLKIAACQYISFVNPDFEDCQHTNEVFNKELIAEAYGVYEDYICDLFHKETAIYYMTVEDKLTVEYCKIFNPEKDLMERLFYFRCMDFAQSEKNYSLAELKKIIAEKKY